MTLLVRQHRTARLGLLVLGSVVAWALSAVAGWALSPEEVDGLRQALVDQINRDRTEAGLNPVALDALASAAGDYHCREMLEHKYISHWDMNGLKPYHRYSLLGGTDYVSENVYAYDTTGELDLSFDGVLRILTQGHKSFMDERPPNDGHRRAILHPRHTHVGIGIAFDAQGVRLTQEFISRYVKVLPLPQLATAGSEVGLTGEVPQGYRLLVIGVFYEPWPQPTAVDDLKAVSYSLPQSRRLLRPLLPPDTFYLPDNSRGEVAITDDGAFGCTVALDQGKGVYTVVVMVAPIVTDSQGQEDDPAEWRQLFPATALCVFAKDKDEESVSLPSVSRPGG